MAKKDTTPKSFAKGYLGPEVKRLQEALVAHHHLLPGWGCDGDFGNETQRALGAFLYEHDLRDNLDPLPESFTEKDSETVEQAPVLERGIDVSEYQGERIDFEKVKASGVSYAFIRAGGGGRKRDPMFTIHYPNASGAGLLRGAYYYHLFSRNPVEQAAHFYQLAGPHVRSGDLRPALDVEDRKTPLYGPKALAHLLACLKEIERLFGCTPILYTSQSLLAAKKINTEGSGLEKYALWVPRYEVKSPLGNVPDCYKGDYAIWQVGADDDLPGISTECDRNLCRVPLETLLVP